ncbi:putative CAAX prenyl protease 2 [Golovinomyces cichoracearum]|uniref:intramembrane prenyl-peptidase Rce1 n=1 Tax=Golovinomyces cichoracearum TaxID=62708 RepID=A0A420HCT3_9PEZI|nr:putative CAAX prenyl protease 2 [Golovinomyces cichoracearum]
MNTSLATALLVIYMLIYVLPFYLSSSTRPSSSQSRDAIPVIRARIRSVTVSCCICSTITLLITRTEGDVSLLRVLQTMGYLSLSLSEIFNSLFLTSILFLAPLFERGFVEGEWKDWIRLRGLRTTILSWTGWRNYVVGPITEEVLFRSASIPLLLMTRMSAPRMILQAPLVFGLAHFHHFYEFRICHPRTPITFALLQSVLQFSYTTVFGGYATFIYLRTSSLLSAILVHAFCNWIGLPRFWGLVGGNEDLSNLDPISDFRKVHFTSSPSSALRFLRFRIFWCTFSYYSLLIVGAVGWQKMLWPLTVSDNRLIDF